MTEQPGSHIMVNAPAVPEGEDAIRCRQIEPADLPAIAELLTRGFPERDRRYWERGLWRLRDRDVPSGYPRFGFALTVRGRPVGVLLLLFAVAPDADALVRCNVSSWYVEPTFRPYASLLVSAALRLKNVTYTNISAAPHTWPILAAQGYRRYVQGQAFVAPLLALPQPHVNVRGVESGDADALDRLTPEIAALLRRHAAYGCLSLVCDSREGAFPFVFVPRPILRSRLTAAQLVYCRDLADVGRLAGNIGRFLLRRGIVVAVIDSPVPLPRLVGVHFSAKAPRYAKGLHAPAPGDLADTELVVFGP